MLTDVYFPRERGEHTLYLASFGRKNLGFQGTGRGGNLAAAGLPRPSTELEARRRRLDSRRGGVAGGADRDRTDDLRLAKPALSQLSYSPVLQEEPGSWPARS